MPQTFYSIRAGIRVDGDEAVLPALAQLRAKNIVWRRDYPNDASPRFSLTPSIWLKLARERQAAGKS
jgi:hypothetical protein